MHRSFPHRQGWYLSDTKQLLINRKEPLILQIIILIHEFTHAYQWQFMGKYYNRKADKLKLLGKPEEEFYSSMDKVFHDKKSKKIYQMFLKESDKIIKISV